MATKYAVTATVGSAKDGNNQYAVSQAMTSDPLAEAAQTVADAPDYTDVDAAVGVLVADGASPTQAHVTDLSDAWDILKPAIDTVVADASAASDASTDTSGNVTLVFQQGSGGIANMNQLRSAVTAILQSVAASGILTSG